MLSASGTPFLSTYEITPVSKKMALMPSCLAAVACVLAARGGNGPVGEIVHNAAADLLGPDFAAQFSVEALRKATADILKNIEGETIVPGTLEALNATHTAARLAEQTAMQHVDEALCLQLLELLCMSEHGSRCADILSNGGVFLACAIIAVAYCISAAPSQKQQGHRLLMCLSRLSSYPPDVIAVHAQIVLEATVGQSQGQ